MSGGYDPACDNISLPKEEESNKKQTQLKAAGSFLSFRHFCSLLVAVVLAATGMVAPQDIAFVIFSIPYMLFLFKFAFPMHPNKDDSSVFNPTETKLLGYYVFLAAIIGLFLPIAYIFQSVIEGDKERIKAASPHLFLLASQVFMEGLAFSGKYSLPIRVFVPVFYNSRRIFTLVDWLRDEFDEEVDAGSDWRVVVGKGVAVANMGLWCFNLFCFLLPVYLPRAFTKYYSVYKQAKD